MALKVNVDYGVPLLLAHVHEHAVSKNSCVVYENVEVAKGIHCGLHEALRALPIGDVVDVGYCLAAHRKNLVNDDLGCSTIRSGTIYVSTKIVYNYLRSLRCKEECVLTPEATASTRNRASAAARATDSVRPLRW